MSAARVLCAAALLCVCAGLLGPHGAGVSAGFGRDPSGARGGEESLRRGLSAKEAAGGRGPVRGPRRPDVANATTGKGLADGDHLNVVEGYVMGDDQLIFEYTFGPAFGECFRTHYGLYMEIHQCVDPNACSDITVYYGTDDTCKDRDGSVSGDYPLTVSEGAIDDQLWEVQVVGLAG